jgi:signal transduction histidine kinase
MSLVTVIISIAYCIVHEGSSLLYRCDDAMMMMMMLARERSLLQLFVVKLSKVNSRLKR